MSSSIFIATLIAIAVPAFSGLAAAPVREPITPPTRSETRSVMIGLSLVEALTAIKAPALAGVFSFVAESDSATAFADYLIRDMKAMKRYTDKLDADQKVAQGLTAWDHEVCANLINFYGSKAGGMFGRPDEKRMSKINQCVLSRVLELETIVGARKK